MTNPPELHPLYADASNYVRFGGISGMMKGHRSAQLGAKLTL